MGLEVRDPGFGSVSIASQRVDGEPAHLTALTALKVQTIAKKLLTELTVFT